MVYSKSIVAALAVAATAYAKSDASSCGDATVQNQGDASTVAKCSTLNGDLTINPQAGATLDFGTNLTRITGKIEMSNDDLIQTLSFNALKQVDSIVLTNLTRLATLNLGALTSIGDLTLENLGTLNAFNFGQGLQTASAVRIENVQISDLSGVASAKTIDSIILSNNQYLSNIMFNVSEVGTIDIGPNNYQQGQKVRFPSLTTATSVIIRNSSVVETPMLKNVSDTLSLIGNTFESYSVPNLTTAGAIVLNSNPKVTNFSFPALTKINGDNSTLEIENNTVLTNINGFPKLQEVTTGAAAFTGNIKNISLPSIKNIAGALIIDVTTDFDCSTFQGYSDNQTVKGDYTCTAKDATPSGSSSTTSSGGSSSSSSGAASSIELPSFLTTGAFAALLAFLA